MLVQVASYAQNGSLKGIASDSTHSEPLIGAVVSMVGNTSIGAVTEVDGSFLIENIPAGTYSFKISYLGYVDHIVSDVKISAGQTTDLASVFMASESDDRMEVTVIGTKVTNSEEAVIQEIKESEQVVSGISSEQIAKSQDRDAAQVVSRVPGVTVINNQFVMVRGLNQRYNAVMLNGVNAPSTEIDSRAFAMDIIPSAMLDRILVFKSGAPELMADMTGSSIKIFTKTAVQENFTNANFSLSYRPGTTFTNQQSQTTYSMDALGFGNASREFSTALPKDFNSKDMLYNRPALEAGSKSLQTDWSLNKKSIMPDVRLGFNIGRLYTGDQRRLSSILSLTYSNTWQAFTAERTRNFYNYDSTANAYKPDLDFKYTDERLQNNVRLGVIWNAGFVLNPRHKFEFKNMFSQNGFSETTVRTGIDYSGSAPNDVLSRGMYYQQRSIYSGQLSGSHDINKEKTNVNWTLGYSSIARNEPNFRKARYLRESGTNDEFKVDVPPQATDNSAALFSSSLKEQITAGTVNIEHQLTEATENREGIKIRAGVYVEERNRKFESRWMSYAIAQTQTFDNSTIVGDQSIETLFQDANINSITGFVIKEGTDGSNKYTGSNQLLAGYSGATIPVSKFIFTVGLRVEQNVQKLTSANQSGVAIKVNNPQTNILPSVNLTYNLTEKQLLRAAFAQTINRPELRELAPFGFYDYQNNWKLAGNSELKNAQVNNYDLRWEYYPNDNESISFGGFYKDMLNPIEMRIEPVNTRSDPAFTFMNAPSAKIYGLEAEVRKSLNFIADKPLLNKISIMFNASLIKSEVKLDQSTLTNGQASTRQLQGQSPYVVNAGLYYNDEKSNLQINVMYNVFGKRIFGVGTELYATIYQVQRHVIDLTVTKGLGKHWELKAGIRDLLNQPFVMKEDSDRDLKNSDADQQVSSYKLGSYTTVGLSYTF